MKWEVHFIGKIQDSQEALIRSHLCWETALCTKRIQCAAGAQYIILQLTLRPLLSACDQSHTYMLPRPTDMLFENVSNAAVYLYGCLT